jgi:hypothetical protein
MSEKLTRTVVPAAPGWSLAWAFGSQLTGMGHTPIVAWAVSDHAFPITVDPENGEFCRNYPRRWALRDPDGVYHKDGVSWDSLGEVLGYLRDLEHERQATA